MRNFELLPEAPDNPYRLGRHRMWDVLDEHPEWEARHQLSVFATPHTVYHQEFEPVFDQGQLGSCTANAALGTLVTDPYGHTGVDYTEADALVLYGLETHLDSSQSAGWYPPHDTGSTGPWSMLALMQQKRIASFTHTRSVREALILLNDGPVSIGVTWYQSMFTLGALPSGQPVITVDPNSGIAGGHQVCLVANDSTNRVVYVRNSWGTDWGDGGHAWLSWSDLSDLFDAGGDAVQPVMA